MDGAHTHGDGGKGKLGAVGLVTAVAFGGYAAFHTKAKDAAAEQPAPAATPPKTVTVVEHTSVWPAVFWTATGVLAAVAAIGAIVWWVRRRRQDAEIMGQQPSQRSVTGRPRQSLRPAAREAMEGRTVQAQVTQGEPVRERVR